MIVTGIMPADQVTVDLFDTTDRAKATELNRAIDDINRQFGRGTVLFAAQKTAHAWQTRVNHKSPAYTTRWEELPQVQLE